MGGISRLLPGLLLALLVATVSQALAGGLGGLLLKAQGLDPSASGSPISAISVAVVVGLLIANTAGVSPLFLPGLAFASKNVLRLGIILVGIKLSLVDVLKVGALGIPVVATLVAFALGASLWIAKRAKVSSQLGSLAAASTAICGITATVAIAPTIEADDREVAYTVANVTLFGLFGMMVYPYLAHWIFGESSGAAGLFLGTAIHDTSQVMGAAMTYREVFGDGAAMEIATVAKLTRNALLVAVVPILAYLHGVRSGKERQGAASLVRLFPMFILGFLALATLRSVGDIGLEGGGSALGFFDEATWLGMAGLLGERVAGLALGMALAGVGLTTRFSVFRGLGAKPFLVGFSAAFLVGIASVVLSSIVGPLLGS